MREPIIYDEVEELSTPIYRVVTASIKDDEMPQYAVINRKYKIVEFTHECYPFIRDWVSHFSGPKPEAGFQLPGEFPVGKGN